MSNAIFVEGFWPHFYARGRFMKYSMSVRIETGRYSRPRLEIHERIPLCSENRNTTFGGLGPLMEDDIRQKTTFDG